MTKKSYYDPEKRIFHINGKTYVVEKQTSKKKSDHVSKEMIIEIDMKEFDKRVEKIIDYIETTFDKRKFLKSLLNTIELSAIEKIERRISKKAKVKEKDGCYNLMIGDFELPVIE